MDTTLGLGLRYFGLRFVVGFLALGKVKARIRISGKDRHGFKGLINFYSFVITELQLIQNCEQYVGIYCGDISDYECQKLFSSFGKMLLDL